MKFFCVGKKRVIISIIISALLTMTTIFGYQIEHYSKLYFNMAIGGALVCLFSVITIVLLIVYKVFDKVSIDANKCKDITKWKIYVISLICLLGIYIIQFLAVYPGLFVFDSSWQYWMYTENTISEHHPVLHTVVLGYIVDTIHQYSGAINHGAAVYTILQIVVCVACMSYVIVFVYGKLKRVSGLALMIAFFGLYPPIVLQVLSATKDTFFFAFMIFLITLTIELMEDSEAFFCNLLKVIMWTLATFFVIVLRNNCIYAIPFFLIALMALMQKKRIVTCLMFLGVLLLFLIYKMLFVPAWVTVEVDGREMYSVPAQQLMRIYNNDKSDISKCEREEIERLFIEDERENYHPRIADLAKGNLDMTYYKQNSEAINKMYCSLLFRNLKLSIESFLENTCGFWYPGCELTLYKDGTKGYWVVDCYYPIISNPKIKVVFDFYKLFENSKFVTKNPITSLFFSPGTFFNIFIIMFGYAIGEKKKEYIVVFIFVLALWLTYLLGPVALVRYVSYLFGIVPLYFAMIFEKNKKV